MEENKNNPEVIDLLEVFKTIWGKKKLFIKVWIVTFILACAYILPIPRTYTSELSLAPELGGTSGGGSLADLASTFGINMNNVQTSDAFHPELYPDLIATNAFIVDLFDVRVKTLDGELETDYYTYLTRHQAKTFYKIPLNWVKKQIRNIIAPKEERPDAGGIGGSRFNPFILSEETDKVVQTVRNLISCSIDKKTFVINITVEDQDPLICAAMADSVRVRLQDFITTYRTSKARIDMNYYKQLTDSAQAEYQKALAEYSAYSDAHQNTILQAYLSERDELETQVGMKLNAFTTLATQYEAAKAKVQEKTPAFTVLKAASVPVKAAHPKRMIFVAAMLILASFVTVGYIFKKDVLEQLSNIK